jgi:murein L,D-transpeptidase YcbB/YkuD
MDKLKFILFFIIVLAALAALGFFGYWSFSTLQSGSEFVIKQKAEKLQKENEDLVKQVADLSEKLDALSQSQSKDSESIIQDSTVKIVSPTPTLTPTKLIADKNQSLINELQELINSNVLMRLKSSGTRVGTVQNFLNIYNNTSNKIDNVYGEDMKKVVLDFQKKQGLRADGEAGVGTFKEMISWLKK